jgi:hypothetical protein
MIKIMFYWAQQKGCWRGKLALFAMILHFGKQEKRENVGHSYLQVING